jgi:hypothetical protein
VYINTNLVKYLTISTLIYLGESAGITYLFSPSQCPSSRGFVSLCRSASAPEDLFPAPLVGGGMQEAKEFGQIFDQILALILFPDLFSSLFSLSFLFLALESSLPNPAQCP